MGRYFVRADGQAGLCEPTASVEVSASGQADTGGTCRQVPVRTGLRLNLGPLVLVLVAARAVGAIMRRARRR